MSYKDLYLSHPSVASFEHLGLSYDAAIRSCAQPTGYSSMWTMLALSGVLQHRLVSFYPYINGFADEYAKLANLYLQPVRPPGTRLDLADYNSLYFLWTSTHQNLGNGSWIANHIVPLYENAHCAGK